MAYSASARSTRRSSFTYEPEYDVAGWAQHSILDGVLAACVVRRSGVDIIAMIVKNGDEYVLGELNPQSEVYQDDGEDYTSTLIPTPLVSSQGGSAYGVKSVFAGVDVYATEGTQFEVCLPGGSWHHVEVGYDTSNTLVPFDKPKVTIPAAAGWEDEPLIAIRSSYAAPLTIAAIGAAIRRGK